MKTEFKKLNWIAMCFIAVFSLDALAIDKGISITAGAAGETYTCVLTAKGGVQCWGNNQFGQLGDGTVTIHKVPQDVAGLTSGVTAIAAGGVYACALTTGGGVKCWGHNAYGDLGDNSTVTRLTPVDVKATGGVGLLSGVSAISAGGAHTCALTNTGGVKCWGLNNLGQLGDNTTTQRTTPVDVKGTGGVGLLSGVSAISTGNAHTCALMTAGGVKCWGYNISGQLGDNTTTNRSTPVDVKGAGGVGLLSGVSAISGSTGALHTCALMATGGMKCWGDNGYGEVGDNSLVNRRTPVDVLGVGGTGLLGGVTAVAIGSGRSCALTTDGGVKCWGSNDLGRLGDNTVIDKYTPVNVKGVDGIGLLGGVVGISAGNTQVCALTTAGGVKCWGSNHFGQLGDNTTTHRYTPINVIGLGRIVKNDYNKNKYAGWIWKGESNGYETVSQIWQVTFPLQQANWATPTRYYPPPFPDQANWEIMTSGDFNSDGVADLLWRNKTTAQWMVWQMQDGTRIGQNVLADFDLAHQWRVVAAADTDNDDDDDIVLNNNSTGEIMIWEMQNYQLGVTHVAGVKAGYVISRLGDFNGDGDTDFLLRQSGGDSLVVWEIEANNLVQERSFKNNTTGWDPVCAGDFDNDGDDDILLVHVADGQEKWFEMQSYARIGQHFGSTNIGFRFLGCGDYNGDGSIDVLWQRSSDDKNRVVLQQNYGVTKQTVYTNPFGGENPAAAGYGFKYRNNGN